MATPLLDSILADDMAFGFLAAGFEESVIYTKAVGGGTRTINVIIERLSPAPGSSQSGTLTPMMRIRAANNATTGISSSEWKNGDTITVAYRKGTTAVAIPLHWPADGSSEHDGAACIWELR